MYLKSPKEGGKKNKIKFYWVSAECILLTTCKADVARYTATMTCLNIFYLATYSSRCVTCTCMPFLQRFDIAFNCILFYLQNYVLKYFVADTSIQKYSYNSETNTNQHDLRI